MAALPQLIDDGCIWHAHAYGACMHMARACIWRVHAYGACMHAYGACMHVYQPQLIDDALDVWV